MNRRDILFRGKRVDNGEWVYGHYVNCLDILNKDVLPPFNMKDYILPSFNDSQISGVGHYEVEPSTIGQYVGLLDKNGVKIFERMELRVKHAMSDEEGCFVDAIYMVDKLTYEGLRLSFARLFIDTPDARSNSYPICQTLSFNHSSLTTDYRNSNYDRIAVNETRGENSLSRSQWKENHYSNDIEVFEELIKKIEG